MHRTKPLLNRPTKVAILVVVAVLVALFVCAMPLNGHAAVSTTAPAASRICALTEEAAAAMPADAANADAAALKRVKGAAKDLAAASDAAPDAIRKDLRKLAKTLGALVAADGPAERLAVIGKQGPAYSVAAGAVARYRAQNCLPSPPPAPSLPVVGAASQTACLSDARTLRTAEDLYATLNGRFATLPELVSARLLRSVSVYYSEVRVGAPAGGYTLIAAPTGPCGNVPVAG